MHKIPAGPHVNLLLLDDTGSKFLDLYLDDLALLGIQPGYNGWVGLVWLATANGIVHRDTLLAMAFVNDGNGVATMNPTVVRCAVNLTMSQNQTRCSGMFLRTALFTATAPDGAGVLFVAVKKNGVVRQLTVV